MHRVGIEAWVAPVGDGLYLVADLLQGIDATRRKFPALDLRDVRDADAVTRTLREVGADRRREAR
jgi:hypothetical protein